MREMAGDFSRGFTEQFSAVVESARGALRGGRGGNPPARAARAARGATDYGPSVAMEALTPEQRAEMAQRSHRRSRVRLLARKWRQGRTNPHGLWYALGFALSALLLVAVLGSAAGGGFYAVNYYNANKAQIDQVAALAQVGSTTIYDRYGNVLYVAPKANGVNIYLKYDQIGNIVKEATVSTEDRTFFQPSNIGIDWTSLLRAALADASSGGASQGGSTITQQLVKNLVLHDNQKAIVRKVNEAILAIGITESGAYKKSKILEMYLDTIDYSDANLGIEAAAQNYFGLSPIKATKTMDCGGTTIHAGDTCWANEQLDWAQAAMLVGVPNAPTIYRPNQFTYDCGPKGADQSTPCDMAHWDNPCVGDPLTSTNCYPDSNTAPYFHYTQLGHEWLVYHRAQVVLDSAERDGYINKAQRDKSLAEVLDILKNHKVYSHAGNSAFSKSGATKLAPHFVNYVLDELENQMGLADVKDMGLKIYTTLDLDLDTYAIKREQYYIDGGSNGTYDLAWWLYCPHNNFYNDNRNNCIGLPPLSKSANAHNAALVAMDPNTGDILAMVGSVDYTSHDPKVDGFVNVATSTHRSMGSSTKPIVYATAFQMGWNPGIMMQDVPVCFPNSTLTPQQQADPKFKPTPDFAAKNCAGYYVPHNYEDHSFSGAIPIRYGLANSLNIPATETMSFVGDSTDYSTNIRSMAQRMGITTLTAANMGPTTALGTQPIPLLQLTNAYGVFAAGGKHVAPRSILEIQDPNGKIIYQAPKPNPAQVISPQAAYMVSSILSDNNARAPAFGTPNPLEFVQNGNPDDAVNSLDFPAVAVKTGTSQGDTGPPDIVTMGYSPYMALGVWVGNSDSTDMSNVIGIAGAGYIFHDVMTYAMKKYHWPKGTQFPVPPDMARGEFNCATGLAPYKDKPNPGICPLKPFPGYEKTSIDYWWNRLDPSYKPDADWYIKSQPWLQS